MIILQSYGIRLVQLSEDKIELVRRWRTDPKIAQFMEYRGEITPEMQKKWFQKITDSHENLYFLINDDGKDVGLINIRNIDWKERTGESGIFIWDDSLHHKGIATRAGCCLYDFAFIDLQFRQLTAFIYNTNPASIKYHQKFGFRLSDPACMAEQHPVNQLYFLNQSTYMELDEDVKRRISKL